MFYEAGGSRSVITSVYILINIIVYLKLLLIFSLLDFYLLTFSRWTCFLFSAIYTWSFNSKTYWCSSLCSGIVRCSFLFSHRYPCCALTFRRARTHTHTFSFSFSKKIGFYYQIISTKSTLKTTVSCNFKIFLFPNARLLMTT